MLHLRTLLNPKSYTSFFGNKVSDLQPMKDPDPNHRGVSFAPPGHFYSPLLDINSLGTSHSLLSHDGVEWWEHLDLNEAGQRSFYQNIVKAYSPTPFPHEQTEEWRYFTNNKWFGLGDAFTLYAIIQKEKPRRIIEVGSGFSSAVMLDTLEHSKMSASLTFIEPYPDRLYSLLSSSDRTKADIFVNQVQEVALEVFDELEAHDILFIDSSHVAKIGSDVTFILLRILPRLKPGVIVHFHDIFYPSSYPESWIREGRAWNESIILRAFLISNPEFQIIAFNSYARHSMSDIFQGEFPSFLEDINSSIWIKRIT